MITEINCTTGEIVEREYTAQELKQIKADQKNNESIETAAQIEAAAKSALLDRLGISESEAKLLLS